MTQKVRTFLFEGQDLSLIRSSGLFDENWYLSNNPDVAKIGIDGLKHYLRHGGFEGRDPSPNFSSSYYLSTYSDVQTAHINPLIHYLRYGKSEQRHPRPRYRCPICSTQVNGFLPINSHWEENRRKYGYPYTFDDLETMNAKQYVCPSCGAVDRDRLYALYFKKVIDHELLSKEPALLDIAPSAPLKMFLLQIPQIRYQSADKYMEGVDLAIDVTDMQSVASGSYDIFICSHVLEHVADDKKALSEMFRILKPGGFGILMVPIILKAEQIDEDPSVVDIETRWKRFGQDDHIRLYSKTGFLDRIQNAGFFIQQYGARYFGRDIFIECGISLKSVLYVVQKRQPDPSS